LNPQNLYNHLFVAQKISFPKFPPRLGIGVAMGIGCVKEPLLQPMMSAKAGFGKRQGWTSLLGETTSFNQGFAPAGGGGKRRSEGREFFDEQFVFKKKQSRGLFLFGKHQHRRLAFKRMFPEIGRAGRPMNE